MLNEDKIRLMTSIAMFEKREGRAIFPASRYFKNDYISSRMLRSFFFYTFSYLLCMLVWRRRRVCSIWQGWLCICS